MSFSKSTLIQNPNIEKCLKRDNYTCQKCGSKEKIIVHHIDNSRKKDGALKMNNNMKNLITLCRPCHANIHGQTSNHYDIPEMREMGLSFALIGIKLGISRQAVHKYYKKYFAS